ncbi:MAG TPA: class I SAM-dependent methyltransferase [Blastocatellia bacterium]|nr:class I SAM-dependent methyltransferase [Blastocatellia bacterium]
MAVEQINDLLESAIEFREGLFSNRHEEAFRLFNGFTEGCPELVVDLYARTIIIHNYADNPEAGILFVSAAQRFLVDRFDWINAVVVKTRNGRDPKVRAGRLVYGTEADRKICENGIWYAIEPTINRDASFYLDTRNVRHWAKQRLKNKSVLNTFAYTGSLGVAAAAGQASRVVQLELNRKFLNIAKTSYTLNGFQINRTDFLTGDFWPLINRLKASGELFDCVFLDAPIYSATRKGVVDLAHGYTRLINKVRPLIAHNGYLVAVNNALFVSGADYMKEIEALCADVYLTVEEILPVPDDFVGRQRRAAPVTDPAPFNHSTKIVVLKVLRKDQAAASLPSGV